MSLGGDLAGLMSSRIRTIEFGGTKEQRKNQPKVLNQLQ